MNATSPLFLCINLERAVERKARMVAQAEREGIDLQLIEAVDGRALSYQSALGYDREKRLSYDDDLTLGEIACALSHRKALGVFLASEADSCVILEDDAELCEGFRAKLVLLAEPMLRLDVLKLYQYGRMAVATFPREDGGDLFFPKNVGCGTVVLCYSRAGAMKVHQALGQFDEAADTLFFYIPNLRIAATCESLVSMSEMGACSTIDSCGRREKIRSKRTIAVRMRRRWRKLRMQLCRVGQVRATKRALRDLGRSA